jgi:hypothetical protein
MCPIERAYTTRTPDWLLVEPETTPDPVPVPVTAPDDDVSGRFDRDAAS